MAEFLHGLQGVGQVLERRGYPQALTEPTWELAARTQELINTLADALRLTKHLGLALLRPEQAPGAPGLALCRCPGYRSAFH
jgi:hypothetical protein